MRGAYDNEAFYCLADHRPSAGDGFSATDSLSDFPMKASRARAFAYLFTGARTSLSGEEASHIPPAGTV